MRIDSDIQVFVDMNDQVLGFIGTLMVNGRSIYVDTRDGTGYKSVLEGLGALITDLSTKYYFLGNTREDTRQDIILLMLEGIPKYDPRKGTRLCTFLTMRTNRLLANTIRDKSRFLRNATFLNVTSFHATCECGNSFSATIAKNDEEIVCDRCGKAIINKMLINTPEVTESGLYFTKDGEEKPGNIDGLSLNDLDIIGNPQVAVDEQVMAKERMDMLTDLRDAKMDEIIGLICYQDYSITDAAERVGMSNGGVNMKLKKLRDRKVVRDILGR